MSESISDTNTRISNFISENFPNVDIGPGSVISELVIKLASTLQNEQYNKIAELSSGKSISDIMSSTTPTITTTADLIASNYNAVRYVGDYCTGVIKVVVSSPQNFYLSSQTEFIQPGLQLNYTPVSDTRVSPNPVTEAGELQLFSQNGLYYFLLNVVATEPGEQYQVASGTSFIVSDITKIAGFVGASAYGNFSSGKAKETDQELLGRLKTSLSNHDLTSYTGICNRVTSMYPSVTAISVCGANDKELLRAKKNVFGFSIPGKADVYIRNGTGVATINITKQAEKIDEDKWVMTLTPDDNVSGFYEVQSIIPKLSDTSLGGTLVIDDISFGFTKFVGQRNNEIVDTQDARFSKYQTAEVSFIYSDSSNIGSTADFLVTLSYQPNIQNIQDLLILDNNRVACADYLVKSVVPCFVSLQIRVLKMEPTDTEESLDIYGLKQKIFKYINSIPFGESLRASKIIDICHTHNIKGVELPIVMEGTILTQDGTKIYLRGSDSLEIPSDNTSILLGVSPKTTMFFIDYYNISTGIGTDNIGITLV